MLATDGAMVSGKHALFSRANLYYYGCFITEHFVVPREWTACCPPVLVAIGIPIKTEWSHRNV